LRSGGESPGGKSGSRIRKVSTPLLYWELGSSGNTNSCVFDGSAPNLQAALQSFKDESHLWQVRGARALLPWALGVSIDGFLVRS